jgi:hypothetical protein
MAGHLLDDGRALASAIRQPGNDRFHVDIRLETVDLARLPMLAKKSIR